MKSRKIRVGLIGCGGIAAAHIPGYLRSSELLEITALADPDLGRMKWAADLLGIEPGMFTSHEEMLADGNVDAVDMMTPHDLHLPISRDVAAAGKHLLVEKVMARNIHECDEMIREFDERNLFLTVCHDRRYAPDWIALKEVVSSGLLGEIFLFRLDHNQNVQIPRSSWIANYDKVGGGAIMSCLTHQIDALRWLGGEVCEVQAMSQIDESRMDGEFAGAILAKMQSGAMANLNINWWTRSRTGDNALWYEMVQVCGTKGEAYFMSGRGSFLLLHDVPPAAEEKYGKEVGRAFVRLPGGDWSGHQGCIEEWAKLLAGKHSNITTTGVDARSTVEVAEAAYLSIEQKQNVTLPIVPRPWIERGA